MTPWALFLSHLNVSSDLIRGKNGARSCVASYHVTMHMFWSRVSSLLVSVYLFSSVRTLYLSWGRWYFHFILSPEALMPSFLRPFYSIVRRNAILCLGWSCNPIAKMDNFEKRENLLLISGTWLCSLWKLEWVAMLVIKEELPFVSCYMRLQSVSSAPILLLVSRE